MPRGAIQVGVSIGAGSAYANDRLAPAAAMADSGRVTYIGFDSLAEHIGRGFMQTFPTTCLVYTSRWV